MADDTSMRSFKNEINAMICGIEMRAALFDPDHNEAHITSEWGPFQDGPALVRVCEKKSTRWETIVFFQAPGGTCLPMHWHPQDEIVLVVQDFEQEEHSEREEQPVVKIYTKMRGAPKAEEHILYVGSVLHISREQLHSVKFLRHCMLQVTWRPTLPKVREEDDTTTYLWPYSTSVPGEGGGCEELSDTEEELIVPADASDVEHVPVEEPKHP